MPALVTWPPEIDEVSFSVSVPPLSIVSPLVASWLVIVVPVCAVKVPVMSIALAVPVLSTCSAVKRVAAAGDVDLAVLVSLPLDSDAVCPAASAYPRW